MFVGGGGSYGAAKILGSITEIFVPEEMLYWIQSILPNAFPSFLGWWW